MELNDDKTVRIDTFDAGFVMGVYGREVRCSLSMGKDSDHIDYSLSADGFSEYDGETLRGIVQAVMGEFFGGLALDLLKGTDVDVTAND